MPQNYDGKFRGAVKMKEALGMSLNVPAVKTLYLVGVNDATKMAKSLGITGLDDPDRYGLSLVLGGGEVKLLDHVNAFATLANGGVKHNKTAILKIEDKEGNILEEFKDTNGDRVVKEEYVAMLDHIISNNKYRAPAFGENNPLRFDDRPVAAKTGTTNEFRDGWTMGYTPSIAVGVWAGNNDNSPMKAGAAGANVAAPIWRSFMDRVLGNYNIDNFPEYNKDEAIKDIEKDIIKGELDLDKKEEVCEIPGEDDEWCLANKYCPKDERDDKRFVNAHNILWYVDKNNPLGEKPKDPEKDPQFKRWEDALKEWYENEDKDYVIGEAPKDECDEDDFEKYKPNVELSVSKSSNSIKVNASADAEYGVKSLKIYIDGKESAVTDNSSIGITYNIPDDKIGSKIEIEVKIEDENGNTDSESKNISA